MYLNLKRMMKFVLKRRRRAAGALAIKQIELIEFKLNRSREPRNSKFEDWSRAKPRIAMNR